MDRVLDRALDRAQRAMDLLWMAFWITITVANMLETVHIVAPRPKTSCLEITQTH
jgi:hypothetical protein